MKNTWLIILVLMLSSATYRTHAASAEFQDFLTRACANATPDSDFFVRCNLDSVDGDLSSDSEDSLNPTQSLANAASAIAETRARIKALQAQADEAQLESPSSGVKKTFRISGLSIILNVEDGNIDRDVTSRERAYETDTTRAQLGFDYRMSDNFVLGATLGIEDFDTVYAADTPGVNFTPGPSEGNSNRESVNVNVFIANTFGSHGYFDAIASWSRSDYVFRRIGLFQEASRTLPTRDVITRADTNGTDLAFSMGFSWDQVTDSTTLQWYGRASYQRSSIDDYRETGGAGFAMEISNDDRKETLLTAGLKLSSSFNTSVGVWAPHAFVEYELAVGNNASQSTQSFLADPDATLYTLIGDEPDDSYGRAGVGLLGVFPQGFTAFVSINQIFSQSLYDELRITAGVRKEF